MSDNTIFNEFENIVEADKKEAILEKTLAGVFNKNLVVKAFKKLGFIKHPTKKHPNHDLYYQEYPDGRKIEINIPFHTEVKYGLLKNEVSKIGMTLEQFVRKFKL